MPHARSRTLVRPQRLPALPALALALLAAGPVSAQLSDLQPGRNFPTATVAFGASRSESIDLGDVDNDGDLDVVVANGGDGRPQANRIYVNQGGLQAGATGDFADGTALRFAGVPLDTSRDAELADFDGDADLDILIANRGNVANGGEVSRAYTNLGGLQFGNAGFYFESTDGFWGQLVSVPPGDEVGAQDGQGPWKDYSCDCDFGDLDDDGDLDLFHSSYGPNVNGTRDSRIFLNDGAGVFDELWPWVDPGADIRLHTWGVDLFDFDGDWDLDVIASSRDSQARVYRSNLFGGTGAGALYTDVTQSALIDTGATPQGTSHYENEVGDLDGDGDFDVWAVNYAGFEERVLINDGDLAFTSLGGGAIKGDPDNDENEADFLDYDGDGDLDVFMANFSGTNSLYQNGTADGLHLADGIFHRTGTASGGSQATWPETPGAGNGGTTLDGECADLDNDGDTDLLLANDSNQNNRVWRNALGIPDTHAPTFMRLTQQADKADGSDTPIRVQLNDNSAYYVIAFYDVDLLYTVDGGFETRVPMGSQAGQQFRAVIPAAVHGNVVYRVEARDRAGNVAVSQTVSYQQSSSASSLWQPLGSGTSGVHGDPQLVGRGTQTPGANTILGLTDAAPNALDALFLSALGAPVPFKGGTLFAFPVAVSLTLVTGDAGEAWLSVAYPSGVPSGLQIWWQHATADATTPYGVTLSNAVLSTAP